MTAPQLTTEMANVSTQEAAKPVNALSVIDLRTKATEAYKQYRDAESENNDRQNAAYIGKYFSSYNGYATEESWLLFCKVLKTENGKVRLFMFQTDNHGKITVENCWRSRIADHYNEISEDEFNSAWTQLTDKFTKMKG